MSDQTSNRDLNAAAKAVSLQAAKMHGVGIPILDEELLDHMGAFEETALLDEENYPEEHENSLEEK